MPLMWNTLIAQGVLLVRVVLLCVYLLLVWEQMQAWQEDGERAR